MTGPRIKSKLDRFELATLVALSALALCVLAGLVLRTLIKGGVVTGADGYLVTDPLQYLNWLRQAGRHGLIGNLYDLQPGPRSFLHPGLLISGLLHRLGLGLVLSYMAWKPVAIGVLFAGALSLTRRHLTRTDDRRLALVLALFACSPASALVAWTHFGGVDRKFQFDFLGGELWSGAWLWGYLFTAIAVGLMPLGLLAYERGRDGGAGGARALALAAAAGLISAWFQPWQGATFAMVIVATETLCVTRRSHAGRTALRDAAPVIAATAAPLIYYFVLSKADASWELANTANDLPRWPLWVTVAGFAPVAFPAVLAYRLPAPDFGTLALRAWPLAGLAIFYSPLGTFPFHALQGLAIPLSVLSLVAVRARLGERALPLGPAVAIAALLIVPGTAYRADEMRKAVNVGRQAHFLEPGERAALRALDGDPRPGGVLTPAYLGPVVPAYTGRETWVGAGSWTPDFDARNRLAEDIVEGRLDPRAAAGVVRDSGARFVLVDCHGRPDITRELAQVAGPPRRFGCARVFTVRAPARG